METLTYQQRIGLVLRHIEQHLDARPNLEELARIACFSPYHFHRIFSSMVGESVAAYVRRLLLERAAMQLGHSPESVTQIALGAGYDSVDAFTRAFGRIWACCHPNTAAGRGIWRLPAGEILRVPCFTMK